MHRPDSGHTQVTAYIALAAAGCLWGTGFLFGKLALGELGVAHLILYRFLFACVGLLPAAFARGQRRTGGDALMFLLAAMVGVPVQFLVQFEGLEQTTVSHASLMVGTLPMLLALAAWAVMRERIGRTAWIAIAASALGVGLIVSGTATDGSSAASDATFIGDALVIVSLLATVAWMLLSKQLMQRHSPLWVSANVTWIGTGLLAAWVLAIDGWPPMALSTGTWLAVAASGLLATSATTMLWNWGLTRVPAARAGVFVNLEPVVGAILGVIVLGERLSPIAAIGGLLIVASAVLVTRES